MGHDPLESQLSTARENLRCAGRLLLYPTPERVAECDALLRSTSTMLEDFQAGLPVLAYSGKQKLAGPLGILQREIARLRVLLGGAIRFFSGWSATVSETARSYDEFGRPVTEVDTRQKISVKG